MTSRHRKPSPKSGLYADRHWYHPLALARRVINYYLLICVALFFLQNYLVFPRWTPGSAPSPDEAKTQATLDGLVPWKPLTPEAPTFQGFVPPDFARPAPRGTIVVFHGNSGTAYDRVYYVEPFSRRGFRTFLYEYPGYGGRAGSPSAASIVPDAQILIRSLDRAGYGPIYVWGESIGTGMAAQVCSDPTLPVHGLVLLTPFDSLAHAAATQYPFIPVSLLLRDNYDSIANLQDFRHPICAIVSTADKILPPRLGLNLFAHLPNPKKLILQKGYGHNDWPSAPGLAWWNEALNFIAPPR